MGRVAVGGGRLHGAGGGPDLPHSHPANPKHLADVRAALEFVHGQSPVPVWLVGTSRGTISAAHVAIGSVDDPNIAPIDRPIPYPS